MGTSKIPRSSDLVTLTEEKIAGSFGQVGLGLAFDDYDIVCASANVGNAFVVPYNNGGSWALVGKFITDLSPVTGTHTYTYTYRHR